MNAGKITVTSTDFTFDKIYKKDYVPSLNKVLVNLSREDILNYGDGKKIKQMAVAKWDITKNAPDYTTMIPKR